MKILVVVDMQEDFNPSKAVRERVVSKIEKAIANKDYIYFTMDTHDAEGYDNTAESVVYPLHCVPNTDGYNIVPEVGEAIAGYFSHRVILKNTFSSWELCEQIADSMDYLLIEDTTVEICGVATDVCVLNIALALRNMLSSKNMTIAVDSHACEGVTEEAHNAALLVMRNNCINVI